MSASLALAIYASCVASAGLGWQFWTWRQTRRPLVVEARMGIAAPGPGTVAVVTVAAINRSDHAVNVSSVGLEMQDGSGRQFVFVRPLHFSTIPGQVAPHDSGTAYIERAEVEHGGIDIYQPVTAWVRLATGDVVRSRSEPLLRR